MVSTDPSGDPPMPSLSLPALQSGKPTAWDEAIYAFLVEKRGGLHRHEVDRVAGRGREDSIQAPVGLAFDREDHAVGDLDEFDAARFANGVWFDSLGRGWQRGDNVGNLALVQRVHGALGLALGRPRGHAVGEVVDAPV